MSVGGGGGDGEGTRHPLKIFANIFISFIGAGVLGVPYAFKEAGIIEGMVIMSAVGVLSVKAMLMIIDSKYKINRDKRPKRTDDKEFAADIEMEVLLDGDSAHGENNGDLKTGGKQHRRQSSFDHHLEELDYGDVGYHAIGPVGRQLVECSIVVSQTGFCCSYIIFISQNLMHYVDNSHMYQWLLILLPPLAILTMLRQLSNLAIFSLFADFANVFAYGVVFWFDFEHVSKVSVSPKMYDWNRLSFMFAISIYCYEGAGMILALEASAAKDSKPLFRKIFIFTMFVVTTLYLVFGVCGYLSFGPETNSIITLNLPPGVFPLLVKGCLCFSLFFTYPVMMFPVVQILEKKWFRDPLKQTFLGNTLRACLVLTTGMVVLLIPSFSTIMSLLGSTCCALLAFILPGLFHMRIHRESISKCHYALDVFFIVLGVVGSVVGTMDALQRMLPKSSATDGGMDVVTTRTFHSLNQTLNGTI
ncbi:amino acid transporter AVT3B-like isoform X3 [Branchiostoma floridae]|uniref:Amino acid transporter AVT3B-like isoform X3 n=1 Tax=Branchiostoma floridae TaxID=7739 RepID=A0A9J7LFD3_BRAFL|nr:amino acid transporter AVT3B-like isoform X3 [Branchiostoma floridae]